VNHLLFSGPLSQFTWIFISEVLGCNRYPKSMEEIMADWLHGKFGVDYQTGLTYFTGIAWAIWNNRNKMCMSNRFPDSPMCVIYLAFSFIQKWRVLMMEQKCQGGGAAAAGEREIEAVGSLENLGGLSNWANMCLQGLRGLSGTIETRCV
jgi:hypothetical protein